MMAHLRANLWLLGLSVLICCVLYPLTLYAVGQTLFRNQAEGSLLDADGKPTTDPEKAVGSRLIAQPFNGPQYFQPRPSSVSWNAAASGASNYAASNYLLRERVAQALGPIAKYGDKHPRAGQLVGPYLEEWLHDHPEAVAKWKEAHADAPSRWLNADKGNAALVADWKKSAGKEGDPSADDVVPFFESVAAKSERSADEKQALQSVFFESWRDAHPDDDLEPVPADRVMTSGSGLDPDITLNNALSQLDDVAAAWAKQEVTGGDEAQLKVATTRLKGEIETMLEDKAAAPFGGLAGVKLVNVLEINLALRQRYSKTK